MKKQLTLCAAGLAAGLIVILPSCDKPAPGLAPVVTGNQDSVYKDIAQTGTASAAPEASKTAPAPAPVPAVTANTVKPPPPPVDTPKAPTPPVPPPTPPVVTTPPPAPPAPSPAPAVASGGTISIKPKMPKPLFQGTPIPTTNAPPNLDKSGKPTLEVQVPAGVELLSKGKPVTTSDPAPLGELSLITDGDKEGDDGYFVDILPGKQWVQIDLGESKEIHLLWVWHFHKADVYYKDVVAQISDDPEFKTATTVFNNDFDDSSKFGVGTDQTWIETNNGRPMPVKGVKGRYVRFWSNGRSIDDTNHYIEIEVYGK